MSTPFKRIEQPGTAAKRKHDLFVGQVKAYRWLHATHLKARLGKALADRKARQEERRQQ